MIEKQLKKTKRQRKIRAKFLRGIIKPRICVFKSNKHLYAQIIDDNSQQTLAAASDGEIKPEKLKMKNSKQELKSTENIAIKGKDEPKEFLSKKIEIARELGKLLAKKAVEKDIKEVFFDRRGYKYHGIVKALADGAREGGLKF